MKKFLALAMAAMMASSVSVFAADDIKVIVDGKQVAFEGQNPVIEEGRTLVPLRGIFEALGATIVWDDGTKTVTAKKSDDTVVLQIGSKELDKNGTKKTLDVPAKIIESRTMVPARAVAESFDAQVGWDDATKTVTITSAAPTETKAPENKTDTTTPATPLTPAQPTTPSTDNDSTGGIPDVKGDHEITIKTVNSEVKAEDGTVVLKASADYPEIANPDNKKEIDTLNTVFKENADKAIKSFVEENTEAAKEYYAQKEGEAFTPYESGVSVSVTFDKGNTLSMVFTAFENTMGAHPNTFISSGIYDVSTGKELAITDITSYSQAEIDKLVTDSFTKLIQANPDQFLEDAEKTLKESLKNVGFYLTGEKEVCFYFNRYEIAPYARGIVDVTLDLGK